MLRPNPSPVNRQKRTFRAALSRVRQAIVLLAFLSSMAWAGSATAAGANTVSTADDQPAVWTAYNGLARAEGQIRTNVNTYTIDPHFSSSENPDVQNRPRFNVTYHQPDPVNAPPDQPVLIRPADGAEGVETAPQLEVTVNDPDGDPMDVSFYGRARAESPVEDFTLVALPDTRYYTANYPYVFTRQVQWIAANQETENIVFVTHLGDVVNTATSGTQYFYADLAMDILDAAGVPYSVGPGDQDMTSGSLFETYFGVSRFTGKSWYGGYYGANNYNNYSLFSASGYDFILINLQFAPTPEQLDWAEGLLQAHPDRRGIVVSHSILNTDNTFTLAGAYITASLKDNPNLFLMLCGHMHTSTDGAAYRGEPGDDGHTIHILLADYQDYPNGGNGYLRLLRFSPDEDRIFVSTYSPYLDASLTTYPDQMELTYDMAEDGAYTLIGTVSGVASGANASLTWDGLAEGMQYEWYAVADDGAAETASSTWSFTTQMAANQAPQITQGESVEVTISEDGWPTPFSLTLNATDADGDTLSWSIATPALNGAASASGQGTEKAISYIPQENFHGIDSFVVQVSDGEGGTDTITVNVVVTPVNDAPDCQVVELTTDEDKPGEAAPTCTDVDGDMLTYVIASQPVHGSAAVVSGTLRFTPDDDFSGADSFTYTANDGTVDSAAAAVTVTVKPVNDAPVASAQSVTTPEDEPVIITLTGSDIENDKLTFTIVTQPAHGWLSGTPPVVTYTPQDGYVGVDNFSFKVNDGNLDSAPAVVSIQVIAGPNHPPQIAQGISTSVIMSEDGAPKAFSLVLDASDEDGDTLTWSISAPASHGTASVSGTGPSKAIGYVPAENYYGEDEFTVQVSDGNDGVDAITVNVLIEAVNDAPVLAEIENPSVDELEEFTLTAAAADVDGDELIYSLDPGAPPGATIDAASGVMTWTPQEADGPGSFDVTIRVTDGQVSDFQKITIDVAEVNRPPVLATAGERSAYAGVLLTFPVTAVDSDLPANKLTFELKGGVPEGAVMDPDSGVFSWTPTEDQSPGTYYVKIVVTDGSASDHEIVKIVVSDFNTAPAAEHLSFIMDEDTVLKKKLVVIDVDGNPLTYSLVTPPKHGHLAIDSSGNFTYIPDEDFCGSDSFTYKANDGYLDSNTATVSIIIKPVNDDPVANADSYLIEFGKSLSVPSSSGVLLNDSDVDGDDLTAVLVEPPAHGSLTLKPDGSFTYTPEAGFTGTVTFTYQAFDGRRSCTAAVRITVLMPGEYQTYLPFTVNES